MARAARERRRQRRAAEQATEREARRTPEEAELWRRIAEQEEARRRAALEERQQREAEREIRKKERIEETARIIDELRPRVPPGYKLYIAPDVPSAYALERAMIERRLNPEEPFVFRLAEQPRAVVEVLTIVEELHGVPEGPRSKNAVVLTLEGVAEVVEMLAAAAFGIGFGPEYEEDDELFRGVQDREAYDALAQLLDFFRIIYDIDLYEEARVEANS